MIDDCLPPAYDREVGSTAYFAQCPVKSKECPVADLNLGNIPQSVRKNIINFLRMFNVDSLKIAPDDVHFYLEACKHLPGLHRLQERCEDILLSSLGVDNAVYMLHMSKQYGLPSLSKESKVVICSHLANVIGQPGFTTLEREQVQDVLELHFKTFGCSSKCLNALEAWSANADSIECDQIRQFVKHMHQASPLNQACSTRKFHITFTVNDEGGPHVVVRDLDAHKLFQSDGTTDLGKPMKIAMNAAICSYQSAETNPPFLVVSGGTGEKQQKRVFMCDIVRNKWKEKKPMNCGRQQHSLCVVNSKLYAIGGYSRKSYTKHLVEDIEEFNPAQNKWRTVASLQLPVYSCTCVAIENKIYIVGGRDHKDNEVPCLQVFDVVQQKVTFSDQLPVNCTRGKVAVVNHAMYLATLDGQFFQINTKTMDIHPLRKQPHISYNFSLFPFGHNVIISYHGLPTCNSCEMSSYVYNVLHDCWLPYDSYKVTTSRIVGQCEIVYPNQCQHIPFCD